MNNSTSHPIYTNSLQGLFCHLRRQLGCLFGIGLALGLLAPAQPVRADIVLLDDDFNDPNNNIGINTNGIGNGFTIFTAANGGVIETNSFAQTLMRVNGADRAVFCSMDALSINNAAGTRYEFRNVNFEKQPSSTGTGATDRLLVGVENRAPAGDFIEAGPASMPGGFWIQFMSDSEINGTGGPQTGTGNGGWGTLNGASKNTVFFYKAADGGRIALATWTFDNLNWGQITPDNFTPALNISITLSNTGWALNITGDTQGGGNPISYGGTYAAAGINNDLLNGLNNVYMAAEGQNEDPGVNILVDRVVVTQLGNLIVPTPMFSTPEYGFATNGVLAGEFVGVSSAVTDSVATATLQWQFEDSSAPGTFTNLPSGTATNVAVNTTGLGDFLPRGIRLIANDGFTSVTSAVVTLTVNPGSAPVLVQDTTPPGPEIRNIGLSISYSAAFVGNRPMTNHWQKSPNGTTWTDIPNATSTSLLLASLTAGDAGYYRLVVTNLFGNAASTASQLTITNGNPKFIWSAPVTFASLGLNANQILTNFPGTKIAGALRGNGGPTTVSLTPNPSISTNIVFAARGTWADIPNGNGGGNGAFPGTNTYTTTGNGNFNTCLNNFRFDGFTHTISMSNLVVGQQYSVQLFALDGRSSNPGNDLRTANYQDPNDPTDASVTFAMSDFVYITGTFYASNTVEAIQQNLLIAGGQGNFNCLVLRAVGFNPPPYVSGQPNNSSVYTGTPAAASVSMTGSAAGDATIPSPTIVYQWQSGPPGGPYTNIADGTKFSGTTTTTLTVSNLVVADSAPVYVLVATNGGGSTMTREAHVNVFSLPPHNLLGHWFTGTASLADTANFIAPGTFDGGVVGVGNFYFTNDVPPNATGAQSLYLFNNDTGVIISNTATADAGYQSTFDNGIQGSFTVMFWAKGWPGQWNPWVSKNGEANGYQFRQDGSSQNFPCWTIRGTGGAVTLGAAVFGNAEDMASRSVSLGPSQNGVWHFYTGTYDSVVGIRELYVDGVLAARETGNGPFNVASSGSHLMIGARENGAIANYFTGNIYDVRIYSYQLTLNEIGTIGRIKPFMTSQFASGKLVLTWPYGTLVQATNVLGPWTPVAAATSPYTNSPNTAIPQLYFRVSNP